MTSNDRKQILYFDDDEDARLFLRAQASSAPDVDVITLPLRQAHVAVDWDVAPTAIVLRMNSSQVAAPETQQLVREIRQPRSMYNYGGLSTPIVLLTAADPSRLQGLYEGPGRAIVANVDASPPWETIMEIVEHAEKERPKPIVCRHCGRIIHYGPFLKPEEGWRSVEEWYHSDREADRDHDAEPLGVGEG